MPTQPQIIFTVINDLNYDQRMHRICTSLAENGYKVTLIGRQKPNSEKLHKKPFNQYRLHCIFHKGKLFYFEFNVRLFLHLLKRKASAICAIDLDTILPCFGIARLKNIYCFHDAHEYFAEMPEVINRPFVKRTWELVANWAIPKMELCYTISHSLAEIFQEKYGKNFHVIRNVPWLQDIKTDHPEEPFILYQGALNEGRGLETLIAAMDQIDLPLYLAGEGDLSQKLRQQVKEEGLDNKVHFLGYVSPAQLKTLTPKAFVGFNILANKGLNYYYSLPNKFFDYMHAGIPILTNNFPEYQRINKQYQVAMLLNLEKDSIVRNIKYLRDNPSVYNQMKNNCLAARDVFNWNQEEKKLLNLYNPYFGVSDNQC